MVVIIGRWSLFWVLAVSSVNCVLRPDTVIPLTVLDYRNLARIIKMSKMFKNVSGLKRFKNIAYFLPEFQNVSTEVTKILVYVDNPSKHDLSTEITSLLDVWR